MKSVMGFALMALSFSTLASTVDTGTFVYDGSQNSIEFTLNTEKTHTEYRTENRRSTCYKREIAGYRTFCTNSGLGYGNGYGYGRGLGYRPYPGRYGNCWSEPVYQDVPYSCMQDVKIPFEVKDFDVTAKVIVDVTKVASELAASETIKVTLTGDALTFNAVGSKKFFIVNKKQSIRSSVNGSVKVIDGLLAVELIEAAPVLSSLKMTDISVANPILNFTVAPITNASNLAFSVEVVKVKTFGADTNLLTKDFLPAEVSINAISEGSEVGIDLSKQGIELASGKFSLTAKIFAKFDGSLMNRSQFGELVDSKTLIYKVR